ncbi:HrpV family type III secretion system protein (plasmid) [Pantoea agglomerans pv. betae]|uniref:HrpV family type III secretion system protein n=1 Tax=Enterobacter agglomerans TaxID=549 RepID=UPI0007E5812C|nr:HrpV family type III secretion system protein [Pantoea agglomerans]WHU82417.1 HrpV family type III secretion system protein [Pantoea agglomerans pv. betae]WHU90650.1 HrpV family type III secretion system protein [Pantoea agglomerans pv. gypsophilae]
MNKSCPRVDSFSALLSLLQLHQSCRWVVQQGTDLVVLCGVHRREAMLNVHPTAQAPGMYQRLLRRRAQQPESYEGCYLCLNSERVLSCWRQLSETDAEDKQQIAQLFDLAGIGLEV